MFFALTRHPTLIDVVKKNDICVECCPISNRVLCYVQDTRCHPARSLLRQGIKVSISPDDNGFWDVRGVNTDYVYAYLAWDLNLADLKALVQNSIQYSSTDEEHKEALKKWTQRKWIRFLEYVRGRY